MTAAMAKKPSASERSRRLRSSRLRILIITLLLIAACKPTDSSRPSTPPAKPAVPEPSAQGAIVSQPHAPPGKVENRRFTEIGAERSGIEFANRWKPIGRAAEELTGPFAGGGVAIADYDGDGMPDIYLTRPQGGPKLFRNMGDWKFEDVTAQAGLDDPSLHGTGASFADIDNDGDLDLHVCCYDGPNRVYINRGDGTFENRATAMGLDLSRASVMCAFHDYDGDGDLDAYLLTNSRPPKKPIQLSTVRREDGSWTVPEEAREHKAVVLRDGVNLFYIDAGERDHLLRNNGDGTFTDVSEEAGISGYDIGLSATWFDANDDGHPDLYVANDFFTPDHFYLNNGDGTFTDAIAESLPHTPWYSMGTDVADINNDGLFDLLATDMAATTHYKSKVTMGNMQDGWFLEYPTPRQYMRNALYLNTGTPRWMEVAHLTGLANTDWTWAVKFADLDNDGLVDLFVANGMTRIWFHSDLRQQLMRNVGGQQQMALDDWLRTPMQSEPNLAYRNRGDLRFESVGESWGLARQGVSFGAATGDLDGDGDLDLVVNNFEAPVSLYRNNSASGHRLTLRLAGTESNRFGIGATVRIETALGIQVRHLSPYSGFYSSSEPLVHFGLGEVGSVGLLTIDWPSGKQQRFENVAVDQDYTITEPTVDAQQRKPQAPREPLFAPSDALAVAVHKEIPFDDFKRQPLLPNRLSQLGPGLAWSDVDGDGDEDLYLSGAKGSPGRLFRREGDQGFRAVQAFPAEGSDADYEDMAPLFFDADGDGDQDLYVVSGGVECEPGDDSLRDRLYLNDGKGNFAEAPLEALPDLRDSGSVAAAADFDRDGDLDLFVGGRSVPGEYPRTPRSRLLRNESVDGSPKFSEFTDEAAPGLGESGMVTGALWSDADGDGWIDLMLTHEWGPVKLWRNAGGSFTDVSESANLSGLLGWWNGITGGDVDGDGDIDYAVSNFGLNTKYAASPEKPALLYYGEFDGTDECRIVEAKIEVEGERPIRGRSCSTHAMPVIGDKFPTFHAFAMASLEDIYSKQRLATSDRYSANELRSGILINDGSAKFQFRPLPRLAQAAPGFGVVLTDVDCDGKLDLYMVQNFFGPQRETGRMAGGLSLLLFGNGDGTFRAVWPRESGLVVPGDAKSLTVADLDGDAWPDFVVGVNEAPVIAYRNRRASRTDNRPLVVRLVGRQGNPTAIGARVRVHFSDGSVQTAEVRAGSGYLSQSTSTLTFGVSASAKVDKIELRWPDGSVANLVPSSEVGPITIEQTGG